MDQNAPGWLNPADGRLFDTEPEAPSEDRFA
jgi:hypothetical protein